MFMDESATKMLALLVTCLFSSVRGQSIIKSWLTNSEKATGKALNLLVEQPELEIHNNPSSEVSTSINRSLRLQQILGYGAGMPQSSAHVLTQLKDRNEKLYWEILQTMFGKEDGQGNINILRFPIGSCDFSIVNTTYDETSEDYNLDNFAIDEDSWKIVAVLKDATSVNPELTVMASPWSPPSWMKSGNSLIPYNENNTLISSETVYQSYARYFEKVLHSYKEAGVTIHYFTLQNEPLFGTSDQYPGMYFSAEQELLLATMVKRILGDAVHILGYDHNWDHPEYPTTLLSETGGVFSGIAWHCYGGDMATAHDQLHAAYPDSEQHLTECTGAYPLGICDISKGMAEFGGNHIWDMSNILLGAAAHWASSGVKWIFALDENCGPTLPLVTFKSGRPLVSIPSYAASSADIAYNQDFWSITHMSRFIRKGSFRVASSVTVSSSAAVSAQDIITESFLDPASGQLVTIAMNNNEDHSASFSAALQESGKGFVDTLPPLSTKIYRWAQ